jgi:hypothetical protein
MNGLAFFYCDGNSQHLASNSAIIFSSVLRQLISQCFSARSHQSLIAAIKTRFDESKNLSIERVQLFLNWISQFFSEIYVIIDGVDECTDRDEFCESLGHLVKNSNIKVLVASRPEQDIATAQVFLGKPALNIDEAVKTDISTHVEWYIEKDRKLRRHKPALKAQLLAKLTAKSDGMCPPGSSCTANP